MRVMLKMVLAAKPPHFQRLVVVVVVHLGVRRSADLARLLDQMPAALVGFRI
jgi:hypothetical protein